MRLNHMLRGFSVIAVTTAAAIWPTVATAAISVLSPAKAMANANIGVVDEDIEPVMISQAADCIDYNVVVSMKFIGSPGAGGTAITQPSHLFFTAYDSAGGRSSWPFPEPTIANNTANTTADPVLAQDPPQVQPNPAHRSRRIYLIGISSHWDSTLKATALSYGSALVLWYSDDRGKTWQGESGASNPMTGAQPTPFVIENRLSETPQTPSSRLVDKPAMTVGPDGTVYIAYMDLTVLEGDPRVYLKVIKVGVNGTLDTSAAPLEVSGGGTYTRMGPQVVVDASGGKIYVLWVDYATLPGQGNILRVVSAPITTGTLSAASFSPRPWCPKEAGQEDLTLASPVDVQKGNQIYDFNTLMMRDNVDITVSQGFLVKAATLPIVKLDDAHRRLAVTWHEKNAVGKSRVKFAWMNLDNIPAIQQPTVCADPPPPLAPCGPPWQCVEVSTPGGSFADFQPSMALDTGGGFLITYYSFASEGDTRYSQFATYAPAERPAELDPPVALEVGSHPLSHLEIYSAATNGQHLLGEYHDVSYSAGTFKSVGIHIAAPGDPGASNPNPNYTWTWEISRPARRRAISAKEMTPPPNNQITINAGESVDLSAPPEAQQACGFTFAWHSGPTYTVNAATFDTHPAVKVQPQTRTVYWVTTQSPTEAPEDSDTVTVNVACPAPLSIVSQPTDDDEPLTSNGTATTSTSIAVSGSAPFTYEWLDAVDGHLLAGPTISSLATNPFSFTFTSTASQSVVAKVTDACGNSVTSNPATLSAKLCGTFKIYALVPFQATTATAAQPVQISVFMDPPDDPNYPKYDYQWMKGDGTLLGVNAPVINATTSSFDSFRVRVSIKDQTCPPITSDYVYVQLYGACHLPPINISPSSQTVTPGTAGVIQAFAAWSGLTFQWYRGESGDTHLPFPAAPLSNRLVINDAPGRYWVRITDSCGQTQDSAAVSVSVYNGTSVCDSVVISSVSDDSETTSQGSVVLSASALSTGSVTYQWFANGIQAAGATNSQFDVSPPQTTTYFVRARNDCGASLDSRIITVHVTSCGENTFTTQPADVQTDDQTPAVLSALTSGPATLQWYEGLSGDTSRPVAGATSTTFTTLLSASTSFWVRATTTDHGCLFDSRTAMVDVCVKPVITLADAGFQNIGQGQYVWIGFQYSGTELQYQWYSGQTGETSQPLGFVTDRIQVHPSQTTFYWVRVSNRCGSKDSPTYSVSICPTINELTPATTVMPNGTVRLHAAADGAFLTYQWYLGLQGVTTHPLGSGPDVTSPPVTEPTQFWCLVTSGSCTAMSDDVQVSLCPTNQISFLGEGVGGAHTSAKKNEVQILRVNAPTSVQLTYFQGQSGDVTHSTVIDGPTSSYGTSISPSVTTSYWVRENDPNGICYSDTPTITINVCIPRIVSQTQSQTFNTGDAVPMTVGADIPGVTFQWYQGQSGDTSWPVTGETAAIFNARPVATSSYWVAVTGTCGASANSATITLTLCNLPAITGQPQSIAAQPPVGTDIAVSATGDALTYQWYVGQRGDTTTKLTTATAATLHTAPAQTTSYWCRVGTTCGAGTAIVDSASATVYVCAPVITQQPVALPSTVQQGSGTSTITVAAGGTGDHYQWYIGSSGDKSQPAGGDSATLVTPVIQQPTSFWVEVTSANGYCTEDSQSVTVSVCTPPSLSWPSEGTGGPHTTVSMNYSQTIQIAVTPAGTPVVFYKGQSGDTSNPLSGAAQANYGFGISPSATTSYWVRAFSNGCTADSPTLTVNVCVPNITAQPAGTTIASGQSAMLTVAADLPGVSYQWYAGAAGTTTSPVAGGTSPSLTISPSATTTYWCRVTSSCTTKDSSAATVTVCAPPFVSSTPQTVYTTYNTSTAISISATGTSLTYQWYSGASGNTATPLAGKTSPSMTVQLTQTGQYWCRVTSSGVCTANSGTVTVDVCQSPTITTQPASTAIAFNTSTTLSIAATAASGSVTYQWYRGGAGNVSTPVSTSASVNIGALTADTQYWCRVTRGACTTDSNVATVTVCALTVSVADVNARAGVAVTLTASATGSHVPSPTYTWYQGNSGDTSILVNGGAGMSQLQVAPAATTHYWVRVNDGSCTANSNTATVNVCIPTITTQPANALVTAGHSTTLTVTTTGLPLTYQWYTGASGTLTNPISGATASSLPVTPAATTSYWVLVGGCGGTSANSATATVTVCTPPSIFPTQRDYNFVENQSGVITVQIGSTPSPTYQWYSGLSGDTSHPVSGGTGYQLTVSGYQPQHYWCRVWSNGSCSSDSTTFNINYCYLGITTQPASTSVAYGTSTTLSLGVSNLTGTPTYQWYVGNSGDTSNPIPGANGATFNTGAVYLTESFWCAAVQGACSVSSDTATVTVSN
jgi:hypothetical protein